MSKTKSDNISFKSSSGHKRSLNQVQNKNIFKKLGNSVNQA